MAGIMNINNTTKWDGPRLRADGYEYVINKYKNLQKKVMFTYWRCVVENCPGACKSDSSDGDIEGFVVSKDHNHRPQSVGASIRERMLCKGEKRARNQRDSIKTIIEDLEAEFLTVENVASVG